MIRLQDIETALMPVVGWEQSYNPARQIDASLTRSESGLTFQGAHPLVTLENLRAVMPDDWGYQYPAWSGTATYAVGAKVSHGGEYWKAKNVNSGSEPSATNPDWQSYDILSDFLYRLTINGVRSVVQGFLQRKQLRRETRNLVERRTFFDGAARLQATIRPTGKLVGFEIVPVRALGVTSKIEKIGLQMTGGTGEVVLYLFHSSQRDPIRTLKLNYTRENGTFQWFDIEDLYLPYLGADTDAGGAWYLCYWQPALPDGMRALNVSRDWSAEPCNTCFGGSLEGWKQITKFMQVSPFAVDVPSDFNEYPELFDNALMAYTNTQNYGLNVEMTVGCDLSDFIIEQRSAFASVIQKQVAVSALRTMAMNPDVRVNRHQTNVTRDQILYEVDGNPMGRTSGLAAELAAAEKALEIDTQGLSRICLCENNNGVKYRTV